MMKKYRISFQKMKKEASRFAEDKIFLFLCMQENTSLTKRSVLLASAETDSIAQCYAGKNLSESDGCRTVRLRSFVGVSPYFTQIDALVPGVSNSRTRVFFLGETEMMEGPMEKREVKK